MPKIPTYLASVGYQPARGNVEAAGAPGRAMAKFGEAAGELGSKIYDVVKSRTAADQAKQEQAKAEAAEIERAKPDVAEPIAKATVEHERSGGSAQGVRLLSRTYDQFRDNDDPGSIMERWRDATEAAGQEIFSTIRNPAARAQVENDYKTLAAVHGALLQGDSLSRLAAKGRDDLAGNLDLYAETAAAARHPLQHDDAVELGLREIANKAKAGFITTEDADRFEHSFYSNIAERQARHAIAFDPEDTLARLNDGAEFGALAEDARARLTLEANRAVQAQTARRESEAAAARRETLIALPGYLDSLRDGGLPEDSRFSHDQVIATLGEEVGTKTWGEIEQAQALGDAMSRVKWATPAQIAEQISGLETDAAQPKTAGLLALALTRRDKQLRDQPADYVLANPHIAELHHAMVRAMAQPILPPAIAAAAVPSTENRRAATAAYANATLAEQERLGLPESDRRVLPDSMAKDLVAGITGGDAAKADRTLRDLAKDWGEAWPRVLADLKGVGLLGEYRLLAGFDDPVARQRFTQAQTAQTAEPGAPRAKAGADADAIDGLLPEALAPTLGRIAQIHGDGAAGQALSDDVTRAAKLSAYGHAPFTEPREAVRRAVVEVGGNALLREPAATTGEGVGGSDNPMSSDWGGWPDQGGESAATPPDPGAPRPQNPSKDKSLLERMLPPPVHPEDAADRAAAMGDAGQRLGRHDPRVPVPKVLVKPKAVPVFLKNGARLKVFDARNQEVDAVIPEGWSLDEFRLMGETLRDLGPFGNLNKSPSLLALASLNLFRRGWPWDLQRINAPEGDIYDEFRPIANFMTGYYGAAIGLPFEVMMKGQVDYAKDSKWSEKEVRSEKYFPLPESNVKNIKRGYDTYSSE